ncbi:hypothetical protein [Streptomyces sp. FH025]|uniref:hypothetical protein n=1 Tax=Streptomyces sp. FH025 TaxID=2815937 RepID=UPI001A9CF5E6|nr:hypothetical protein [Streptomyces sp. FH025]MBO1415098.1 hypothetical protein [Streptomyces sp. FH025]
MNPLLTIEGRALQVVRTSAGWALRISTSSAVELYGPSDTSAQAEEWLLRYAAWRLWQLTRTRGPWGCLARAPEGWMTALARTALPPTVQLHLGVQDAEVHAAAHLIAPAGWSAVSDTSLPPGVWAIETQFWVREGYRVMATWATADLGAITRDAYRNHEIGRGNYSPTDLAERLGVSHAAISAAASGRGWNPSISKAVGVLARR